jgi:hypothetical protein
VGSQATSGRPTEVYTAIKAKFVDQPNFVSFIVETGGSIVLALLLDSEVCGRISTTVVHVSLHAPQRCIAALT